MEAGGSPEEVEVAELCRAARARLQRGDPLSRDEVARWLDLVDDERHALEPSDEPPQEGWHARPGGALVQVGACARELLRQRGGERSAAELAGRLETAGDVASKRAIIARAIDLLGLPNPVLTGCLAHRDADRRVLALTALRRIRRGAGALELILPRLLDDSAAVVAAANAAMRGPAVAFEALPRDAPRDLCERARARLGAPPSQASATGESPIADSPAPLARLRAWLTGGRGASASPPPVPPPAASVDDRRARLESFANIAVLAQDWPALAAVAASADEGDTRLVFGVAPFRAEHVAPLLALAPQLRGATKAAAIARFEAAPPGRRDVELALICRFAPDPDIFELGLAELRLGAAGARAMAAFARDDAACMPSLLAAALENPSSDQFGAAGLAALFDAAPRAFAMALAAQPAQERERRMKTVVSVWSTSTHARCVGALEALVAQLAPKPEKAVRRNYRPPDWTGSGKKPGA